LFSKIDERQAWVKMLGSVSPAARMAIMVSLTSDWFYRKSHRIQFLEILDVETLSIFWIMRALLK